MAEDPQESIEPSNTWKFFVAFGIILLLIVSIQGYRAWDTNREQEANRYNGFDFSRSAEGFWVTQIQVEEQPLIIPFYHHPRELEDILMDARAHEPILSYRPQEVVIAVHPDGGSRSVVAGVEIARITGSRYNLLNIPTRSALSAPSNESIEIEVVSCKDANNSTTVIEFIQSDKNAILVDGSCVMLLYQTPEDSIRVADRYAYRLLRIMR